MAHRCGAVVQLVRIPACHAGGPGFEPRPLRQNSKSLVSQILTRLLSFWAGCKFGSNMLNLPVYRRGHTYYLHTRIAGRQFKRSLRTSDTLTAMIRATKLLEAVAVSFDLSRIRKYELDLSNGIVRADGPEDHGRLMDALDMLLKVKQATRSAPPAPTPQPPQGEPVESLGIRPATQHGLTLLELLDKYLLLKQVKPVFSDN